MFFIPWHLPAPPSTWQQTVRFEDAIDAFNMLGNNWQLLFASVGTVISIAFFNFAGLTVTSTMNATTRMVLDSVRTIFIWVFSLAIGWQHFQPLQPVGYFMLFVGTCIYYDVIILPAIRWVMRQMPIRHFRVWGGIQEPEEEPLLGKNGLKSRKIPTPVNSHDMTQEYD